MSELIGVEAVTCPRCPPHKGSEGAWPIPLSPRQQQVAELLGREGLPYKAVAARLGLRIGTVARYAHRARRKAGGIKPDLDKRPLVSQTGKRMEGHGRA